MQLYREKDMHSNSPHIYALGTFNNNGNAYFFLYIDHLYLFPSFIIVAIDAFCNITDISQSIMITGISGSGKTESAKHIVENLCNLASETFRKDKIINANSILEAFGNARTKGNKNSSRFCKFLEVSFDLMISFYK